MLKKGENKAMAMSVESPRIKKLEEAALLLLYTALAHLPHSGFPHPITSFPSLPHLSFYFVVVCCPQISAHLRIRLGSHWFSLLSFSYISVLVRK